MQYDPFQLRAIEAVDKGHSVLVSAPTGAGKTVIAEYAINAALARGQRVVYTAPIKALSNQKFRDFTAIYPDKVGLLTGDVSLNPQSPLLIMTTEIYRNQLFEDPERLKDIAWVIFDEVHYLDDPERGTVWEEAMMFSPPDVRFICLSATAPNIAELGEWIEKVLGHPIELIIETHRPVPLQHLFQCQGQLFSDPRELRKVGYAGHDRWKSDRGGHGHHRRERFRSSNHQQHMRAKPNRLDDLVRHLVEQKRLPCLYFAFGRKRTEELAWEMQKFDFLTPQEKVEVDTMYNELSERFGLNKEPSAIEMKRLLLHGIGFHHAGMLPTLKEAIERLFTSKLIKLIFTTETFAIGINMPAKSVVFDELRKFYGTGFAYLRTRDYFQMAGRAGRRGMDKEGYVYSRLNPHLIPHDAMMRVVFGQPEAIESQFNSCYATILNLYSQFGSRLIELYPKSFHHFQSNKHDREKGVAMMVRKINLLRDLGHIQGEKLSPKGEFASWMYGYELLLSEMMEGGYLDKLDEPQLAMLLCSLVYEPRKNADAPRLPSNIAAIEANAMRFARTIHLKEAANKVFPPTRQPYFHLARAMEAWVFGVSFQDLIKHTEVDEGEVIRIFRMVVQLLRQLKQAPRASEKLRGVAGRAQKKIARDLVDAEKQLRNMEEEPDELPEDTPKIERPPIPEGPFNPPII